MFEDESQWVFLKSGKFNTCKYFEIEDKKMFCIDHRKKYWQIAKYKIVPRGNCSNFQIVKKTPPCEQPNKRSSFLKLFKTIFVSPYSLALDTAKEYCQKNTRHFDQQDLIIFETGVLLFQR
jgi:hypothetical protein